MADLVKTTQDFRWNTDFPSACETALLNLPVAVFIPEKNKVRLCIEGCIVSNDARSADLDSHLVHVY